MASNQDDMEVDMEVYFMEVDAGPRAEDPGRLRRTITKDPDAGWTTGEMKDKQKPPEQKRGTLLVRDRPTPPQLARAREQKEYEEDLQRKINEDMKKKRSVRDGPGSAF